MLQNIQQPVEIWFKTNLKYKVNSTSCLASETDYFSSTFENNLSRELLQFHYTTTPLMTSLAYHTCALCLNPSNSFRFVGRNHKAAVHVDAGDDESGAEAELQQHTVHSPIN